MNKATKVILICFFISFTSSCSTSNLLSGVSGAVTIDGQPVESGTIHFQPVTDKNAKGAGGLVEDGKFVLSDSAQLTVGDFDVVLQAFKETGRIVKDPQKGDVKEMVAVSLAEVSKRVSLSADNYRELSINFSKL